MSKKMTTILPVTLIITLLTIEIMVFGNLFPWTGLKAIIVLPVIYGIFIAIIILGVFLTRNINSKFRIAIWSIIFLVNSLIAASMYPQEFRPTVLKQIVYTLTVVKNYQEITKEDLILYIEDEYYPYDKSVPDDRERYVAALHKFKNEIKKDGSQFLFGKKDKPILKDTDIQANLETGQDRLIWWLLQ